MSPKLQAGFTEVADGERAGSESDYGLSTGGTAWEVTERYDRLTSQLGLRSAAVARQVHGAHVVTLDSAPPGGVHVQGEADGLTTTAIGVLLVVTAADCVPVYMVGPEAKAVGILHAGWRGIAAGILEAGLTAMQGSHGVHPSALRIHLGPAICGACYEVGQEVARAVGAARGATGTVDLREGIKSRALDAGVSSKWLSVSEHCTKCGPKVLFSHRGQGVMSGRMAAFVGRTA
jgi:YfiH family protein